VGGDGEEVDGPTLWRVNQHLFVVVEVGVSGKFIEAGEVSKQLLVLIGVAEGELDALLFGLEGVVDGALEFPVVPLRQGHLALHALPAAAVDAEDRPVALGVLGLRVARGT
jgi:hypothetical protein